MDEEAFGHTLRRAGKKPHVVDGLIAQTRQFESYLAARGSSLDAATAGDLVDYAAALELDDPGSTGKRVRGVMLYYAYAGRDDLAARAAELRETQTAAARRPFPLRDFRGVDATDVATLAAHGIADVAAMLAAGRTPQQRRDLAQVTGVAPERILELVKLADLSRLGGLKGIRARLYYDAGAETPAVIAGWEPATLEKMLAEFVARSGFDGLAPLPKEVRNAVRSARLLPPVVEYE